MGVILPHGENCFFKRRILLSPGKKGINVIEVALGYERIRRVGRFIVGARYENACTKHQ
jgi:hypothetical protein